MNNHQDGGETGLSTLAIELESSFSSFEESLDSSISSPAVDSLPDSPLPPISISIPLHLIEKARKELQCRNGIIPVPKTPKDVSFIYLFFLTSYWMASTAQQLATSTLIAPLQILAMVGSAKKGRYLGVTFLVSSFVSLLTSPISGDLSDRTRLPIGRRRLFVIIGTLIRFLFLILLNSRCSYFETDHVHTCVISRISPGSLLDLVWLPLCFLIQFRPTDLSFCTSLWFHFSTLAHH